MALMPRCVARLLSDALQELNGAGYAVTVVTANGEAPGTDDVVVAQTPARDTVVTAMVATLQTMVPGEEEYVIPDLLGLSMLNAEGFYATLPLGSPENDPPIPLHRSPADATSDALVTHWNVVSGGGGPSDPPKSVAPPTGAIVPRGQRLLIISRPGRLPPLPAPPNDEQVGAGAALGLGLVAGTALGVAASRLLFG